MMKRGLSTRDLGHTTSSLLRHRQQPIRDELRRRNLDAAVISSDISTGSDIAYLTHLTLYWSTALLVIGADGDTIFMPALSPRTESWFGETGLFDEVRSGTNLLGSLSSVAQSHGYRRLGLIERRRFPQELLRGLEMDPKYVSEDLGAVVRRSRLVPDGATLTDARRLSELTSAALERFAQAVDSGLPSATAAADAEYILRSGGVWDAMVTSLKVGNSTGVRLRAQLRDAWVESERVISSKTTHVDDRVSLREWALHNIFIGATAATLRKSLDDFTDEHPELAGAAWDVTLEPASEIEVRAALCELMVVVGGALVHISVSAWSEKGDCLTLWGDTVLIDEAGTARSFVDERYEK